MMELKVSQPDECVGLVPDWKFLKKLAKVDQATKERYIDIMCGSNCAFIAINWNESGKAGEGLLPYEFRLLPASIARCKISLNKIIAIRGDPDMLSFQNEFNTHLLKANQLFARLLKLNDANHDEEQWNQKMSEYNNELAKLKS